MRFLVIQKDVSVGIFSGTTQEIKLIHAYNDKRSAQKRVREHNEWIGIGCGGWYELVDLKELNKREEKNDDEEDYNVGLMCG